MNNQNNQQEVIYDEYYRKSTDSEDRQVQSVPDQIRELAPVIARRNLKVAKRFEESMSAKRPGRPDFNELIRRIEAGEVNGIICWKINRLARNPIDGGKIQWLLQEGILKSIITPGKEYLPTDNVLMMAVELGVANQFSIDLSRDVARGMGSKAAKGWRPCRAPLGYMNDPIGLKGEKKIFTDPVRFPIVRKMWDMLLTGMYTVKQIVDRANNEWGLSTKPTKKQPSKKLSYNGGYKIFTRPFYYGSFYYNGELKQGQHQPMISLPEFDLAQRILGKSGKPRPKYKRLPFNGVITCGNCGGMISADEKIKYIKCLNKTRAYMYHRCSKNKKGRECHQKPISYEDLKAQIVGYLDKITIPEEFLLWAVESLRENNEIEEQNRTIILANQRKLYDDCLKRIDNLMAVYIAPNNVSREFLSDEEYLSQKNALIAEKGGLEGEMRRVEMSVDEWMDLTEKTFNFATYAKAWFEKGDYEQKTQVLAAIGQNFTFMDGKLDITLAKPFLILKQGLELEQVKTARCELPNLPMTQRENRRLAAVKSQWSG